MDVSDRTREQYLGFAARLLGNADAALLNFSECNRGKYHESFCVSLSRCDCFDCCSGKRGRFASESRYARPYPRQPIVGPAATSVRLRAEAFSMITGRLNTAWEPFLAASLVAIIKPD